MTELEKLLLYVQKTNKDMTMDKLLEELQKSRYSALCLALVCMNDEKAESLS